MQASVKVLRSYDYCHFEVALTAECENLDAVNDLRKQAAVLVDEAVRQYKIAKAKESKRDSRQWEMQNMLEKIQRIEQIPESQWTVEQAALMRAHRDRTFWKDFEEDSYCYQDPEREHHFSMLRRFQDVRIKP